MLRRPAKNVILNSLDTSSFLVNGGKIYIKGLAPFAAADVVSCYKSCATDGTAKVVRVCVTIPDSCVCPYTWSLQIHEKPKLLEYETNNTFTNKRLYEHTEDDGSTPTAASAAAGIVEQINADAYIKVTAEQTDSDGVADDTGTCITLTADEEGDRFDAFTVSGTITEVTAGVENLLDSDTLAKKFPIKPGAFGERPDLTNCGDYCVYYLKIKNCCSDDLPSDSFDVSMDRAIQGHEMELYIYVRNDLATFAANWDDLILAELTCFGSSS